MKTKYTNTSMLRSAVRGDTNKNFPEVVRPARRRVEHQESCMMSEDYKGSSMNHGRINYKPKHL